MVLVTPDIVSYRPDTTIESSIETIHQSWGKTYKGQAIDNVMDTTLYMEGTNQRVLLKFTKIFEIQSIVAGINNRKKMRIENGEFSTVGENPLCTEISVLGNAWVLRRFECNKNLKYSGKFAVFNTDINSITVIREIKIYERNYFRFFENWKFDFDLTMCNII